MDQFMQLMFQPVSLLGLQTPLWAIMVASLVAVVLVGFVQHRP